MPCCFSRVRLPGTLWTVACQAPLSMGFCRQEDWSGLPSPPPGDLPDPGIKPESLALAGELFTTEPTGKPPILYLNPNLFPQDWKRSVFIPITKKGNAKECSNNCTHLTLLKQCSKFSKPGFNNTWTMNFQMFKLVLEKAEAQRSNCQHPLDHRKSKRVSEKHLFLLYWLCQSPWLCGSQQTVENSERDGNTRPPDLPLEKSVYKSGSNS